MYEKPLLNSFTDKCNTDVMHVCSTTWTNPPGCAKFNPIARRPMEPSGDGILVGRRTNKPTSHTGAGCSIAVKCLAGWWNIPHFDEHIQYHCKFWWVYRCVLKTTTDCDWPSRRFYGYWSLFPWFSISLCNNCELISLVFNVSLQLVNGAPWLDLPWVAAGDASPVGSMSWRW